MCSISWIVQDEQLHVLFNRDENKARSKAVVPSKHYIGSTACLFPVDPDGGGTWLTVNEHGVVVGLLNYYQGRLPKGRLRSRGQLVKELSVCATREEVNAKLANENLSRYAPFSLMVFDRQLLRSDRESLACLNWTGSQLKVHVQARPLISSAIWFSDVKKSRLSIYHQEVQTPALKELLSYHSSHSPEPSAYSVCMHREDASTVSFSHICISAGQAQFRYFDGPPCEQPNSTDASLALTEMAMPA